MVGEPGNLGNREIGNLGNTAGNKALCAAGIMALFRCDIRKAPP